MSNSGDLFFVAAGSPQHQHQNQNQNQHQNQHQQHPGPAQELSPDLVASLVERFYNRASLPPAEIAKINTLLVQVQSRNASLELPEQLLQSSSPQVRFYAAVLFGGLARKLSPDLSSENKAIVKDKYVHYVTFAIDAKYGLLEFAKLSRACTDLYVAVREWEDCFRQVARVMLGDAFEEYNRLSRLSCVGRRLIDSPPVHTTDPGMAHLMSNDSSNPLQAFVNKLDDGKAILLVNFMGSIVEGLFPDGIELPEIEKVKVSESFISTCQSLLPMLSALMNKRSLLASKHSPTTVISLMLKHPMFLESSAKAHVEAKVEYLARSVWLQVLQKLTSNTDGASWQSIEAVLETVFHSHKSWVGRDTLNELLDFALEPNVGLVKYASASPMNAEQLDMQHAARRLCKHIAFRALEMEVINTHKAESFLRLLDYLAVSFELDDEGCEWAAQVVLFWTDYAEYLQSSYGERNDAESAKTLEMLLQPMLHAMTFIFPRLAIPEDPDDDYNDTLIDIQLDAQSLFAQAYVLFDGRAGKMHGRNPTPGMIMQTEPNSSLYGTATPELAVRTLSGLAEQFTPDPRNDETICLVFGDRMFEPLTDAFELSAPLKSRQVDACIELISKYAPMLARNPQYLGRIMEFLFSILETNMNAHDPEVGKAVKSMCLASRVQLIPHFNSLIQRYQGLQDEGIYFPEAKVDILASFGIVAHAVDKANGNLDAIARAIKILEEEVETFLSIPDPEETTFTQDGIDALQAILELGKLVRNGSSKETAIALDDDIETSMTDGDPLRDQAVQLQQLVTKLMSTLASSPLLDQSDEAFRAIWDTLRLAPRTRPTDLHMVIFDFGLPIYLEVLTLCLNRNVTADYALDTFGQLLVARHTTDSGEELQNIAYQAFTMCARYMESCSTADDGGDSMGAPLRLFTVYLGICPNIVNGVVPYLPRMIDLVTPAVTLSNLFTQEAACEVWSTLLRSNEAFVNCITEAQIATLSLSMVQQICGEAMERSIWHLSSVIAALGSRGGPCKKLLEVAFQTLEEQGKKVANWQRFVQQVFLLKGNLNDTRRVTEQFWKADRLANLEGATTADEQEEAEIVVLGD